MNCEQQAVEYAMNQFHGLGVAVSTEGIERVLHYIDEFYMEVWEPSEEDGITVIEYTEEEKRKFIQEEMPDVPHTVIQGVLDAEQRFFGGVANE